LTDACAVPVGIWTLHPKMQHTHRPLPEG